MQVKVESKAPTSERVSNCAQYAAARWERLTGAAPVLAPDLVGCSEDLKAQIRLAFVEQGSAKATELLSDGEIVSGFTWLWATAQV